MIYNIKELAEGKINLNKHDHLYNNTYPDNNSQDDSYVKTIQDGIIDDISEYKENFMKGKTIKAMPNNKDSSRSHLFIKLGVKNSDGKEGEIILIDFPGSESFKNYAPFFGNLNLDSRDPSTTTYYYQKQKKVMQDIIKNQNRYHNYATFFNNFLFSIWAPFYPFEEFTPTRQRQDEELENSLENRIKNLWDGIILADIEFTNYLGTERSNSLWPANLLDEKNNPIYPIYETDDFISKPDNIPAKDSIKYKNKVKITNTKFMFDTDKGNMSF